MSFSVLRERKKMSEKKSEWYAEDRKPFRRMEEQFICDKLGLKSTNVLFRIPRDRIFETDGGNPDDVLQVFKSDDLPEYVEGKVESIIRASGKHRLVISLKPFEFKKKEKQIARDAIKSHGSIEAYTDHMINNLLHLSELVDDLMATTNGRVDKLSDDEDK